MWAVHPSNTSDTSLQKCLLAASPREDRRGTTSAAIVRGEDDDGVVVESVRLQSLHHSAHPSVQSLCFVFAKMSKKKLVNKNCCSDRSSCVCGSHCSITAVCTVFFLLATEQVASLVRLRKSKSCQNHLQLQKWLPKYISLTKYVSLTVRTEKSRENK